MAARHSLRVRWRDTVYAGDGYHCHNPCSVRGNSAGGRVVLATLILERSCGLARGSTLRAGER